MLIMPMLDLNHVPEGEVRGKTDVPYQRLACLIKGLLVILNTGGLG